MALRPVSELGLMDLTDLAEREESGPTDPQTNPQAEQIDKQPQSARPATTGRRAASKPKTSGSASEKKTAQRSARRQTVPTAWTATGPE